MVFTLTLNPALDYYVNVADFKTGIVNRVDSERIEVGGKGINVSAMLTKLYVPTMALGIIGGFVGCEIINRTRQITNCDFICNSGISRINFKMMSDGKETEINGVGSPISAESFSKLCNKIEKITENDVLILSGSLPPSIEHNFYSNIMEMAKTECVIVDVSGQLLLECVKNNPFLVKPNIFELGTAFGVELKTKEDVVVYAKKLQELGAVNVLVSMGKDGAVLVTKNSAFFANAPLGKVVNSVGAGDSMLAGFVKSIWEDCRFRNYGSDFETDLEHLGELNEKTNCQMQENIFGENILPQPNKCPVGTCGKGVTECSAESYKKALTYAVATGSAKTFTENMPEKSEVEKLLDEISVVEL
jgi:1-phosphofructokinase